MCTNGGCALLPSLSEYQDVWGRGWQPFWLGEEEEVLDNDPPGVLEFVNSVGLVAPGSRTLYVKLNTGNERCSSTVSVVRE